MPQARPLNLMREPATAGRVTNIELFFDLVYVFAVTQLSHFLLDHASVTGALRAGLLLAMVWQLWVYTTWVTNWLNPERMTGASLVMSAALPGAFSSRGLAVGGTYAVMQIGRSVFAVIVLRGRDLQRNFQRILCWCLASGALAVAGGIAAGGARVALWVAAVGVDLLGGIVGFYTPGLGRSTTHEWTIEGGHFAERCQAFVLIALGESIVVIGATLSGLAHITTAEIAAFVVSLTSSAGLWWLYFDRSAGEAARIIAASDDPGRLGRSAYHFLHPVMVAGAPVTDMHLYDTFYKERYLGHPDEHPEAYAHNSLLADAPHLERPLMLIHGLVDDNVVVAHTLRMSSALLAAGRPHTVLPLSGVTHMARQEEVAENLMLLQVDFLKRALHMDA